MIYKITDIRPDPNQPRTIFDEKHIKELAISIRKEGVINPIEIDPLGMIITGECRYLACIKAGLKEVPVNVNFTEFDEYERLRHQMAENVHQSGGEAMNPIDTAKGYQKLLRLKRKKTHEKFSVSDLSKEIGVPFNTVFSMLELLKQPQYLIEAVEKGIPRTYLEVISGTTGELRGKLQRKIARGDYKGRDQLIQTVKVAGIFPDLAVLELERNTGKESTAANRILNAIVGLGLRLEEFKFKKIHTREQKIIRSQLKWIEQKIEEYLPLEAVDR